MVDAHILFLAGLVSQATFTLTFGLLAWSDRRTRGMRWLAGASMLQLLLRSVDLFPLTPTPFSRAFAACAQVLLFFMLYAGSRWFAVRRPIRSRLVPGLLGGACAAIAAASLVPGLLALNIARLVSIGLVVETLRLLWRTRLQSLRLACRLSGFTSLLLGLIMGSRLVISSWLTGQAAAHWMALTHQVLLADATLVSLSFLLLYVAETNRRLHDETRIDVLTGLRNRRALEEAAARELRRAYQLGLPFSLLMLDLDRFKQLNDTWGHALGDRALQAVGSILQAGAVPPEHTARMGGEEFAVLLPGYTLTQAAAMAERIRSTVAALRLPEGDGVAELTVSIGVSQRTPGHSTWSELMIAADKALYDAKRQGRDRVVQATAEDVAPPSSPPRPGHRRSWRDLLLPRRPLL